MTISNDFIYEFQNAMQAHGIACNNTLLADGNLHRFHIDGDKLGTLNGWYVLHAEPIPIGFYGCWKRGIDEKWCLKQIDQLSPVEKNAFKQHKESTRLKYEQEQNKIHKEGSQKAQTIWNQALPADENNDYLKNKAVKSYGLRCY